MLKKLNLEHILFLDIETVPEVAEYSELDTTKQSLWELKSRYQRRDEYTPEAFYNRAGIWAEFGKIICISVGYFKIEGDTRTFRVTSFHGDEIRILKDFKNLIITHFGQTKHLLCAHNGKEFDFPFLGRRILINGLKLPSQLNIAGKKPWEIPHIDTMDLWKFGDYKHYTSLDLLAHVFNIESPKKELDGSKVAHTFYEEKDLEKIKKYCQADVVTTAQLLLKYKGISPITKNNTIII